MSKNQLMPLIGKVAQGMTKYYLVKVTGHKNNNVMNVMELNTGKVFTRTLYNSGTIVDTLSRNPKRISKTIGTISKLIKK